MIDNGMGDYFISDTDEEIFEDDEELIPSPVVVPVNPPAATPKTPTQQAPTQQAASPASAPRPVEPLSQEGQSVASERIPPQASVQPASREDRLAAALDQLMANSPDIQASALVSLDGFIMASALPEGVQEDRVGAMSAAILGLGERAAAELGRGRLTQVFIEGADGYVILIAAGNRAALTALAQHGAKLGLVLFDMRIAASSIAEILR